MKKRTTDVSGRSHSRELDPRDETYLDDGSSVLCAQLGRGGRHVEEEGKGAGR